jgi:hypothetical protein
LQIARRTTHPATIEVRPDRVARRLPAVQQDITPDANLAGKGSSPENMKTAKQ